tara:strand:+ start:859 stop:1341 length:483 start_codon:yes stop_codon:yes gene_type:complete
MGYDMIIYGIDPGFTGAVSIYDSQKNKLECYDIPTYKSPKGKTLINLHALLDILTYSDDDSSMAVIERVNAMPNQGVSSTFRFGQGYGQIEMGLAACKLAVHYVSPAVWKKHFGLNRDKGVSRGLVTQRLPQYAHLFARVKDDGRAEATLIALYAAEKLI